MGENPVWQFVLWGKKKEREKEKGGRQANASESNMLLPG